MNELGLSSSDPMLWGQAADKLVERKQELLQAEQYARIETLFEQAANAIADKRSQLCARLAAQLEHQSPEREQARRVAKRLFHSYHAIKDEVYGAKARQHLEDELAECINELSRSCAENAAETDTESSLESESFCEEAKESEKSFREEDDSLELARIRLMIDVGAPLDLASAALFAPLYQALLSDDLSLAERLIDAGASVNGRVDEYSFIARASLRGFTESVSFLLAHGASPDGPDDEDEKSPYPLICATLGGHLDVVRVLIDAGASVNIRQDESCETPLRIAAFRNDTEIVKELLAAGAQTDCTSTGSDDTDILLFPAIYNNAEMLELILDAGDYDEAQSTIALALNCAERFCARSAINVLNARYPDVEEELERVYTRQTATLLPYPCLHQPLYDNALRDEAAAHNALKLMGHATHLKGRIEAIKPRVGWSLARETTQVSLTGHLSQASMRLMGLTWHEFCKRSDNLLGLDCLAARQIRYALFAGAHLTTQSRGRERFVQLACNPERASIIPIGFESHATVQVLWKGFAVYCNRGAYGYEGGAHFLRWSSLRKDAESLYRFSVAQDAILEESYCDIRDRLHDGLKSDATCELLSKHCTLPEQEVGNCTWTSVEMAMLALMTIAMLPETPGEPSEEEVINAATQAAQIFADWQLFTVTEAIREVTKRGGALESTGYCLAPPQVTQLLENIRLLPTSSLSLQHEISQLKRDYDARFLGPSYQIMCACNTTLSKLQEAAGKIQNFMLAKLLSFWPVST